MDDITPMLERRYSFGVATLNGKIYACGGMSSNRLKLSSVEVYDPITKLWTLGASMQEPRSFFGMVSYVDKLWAIGGHNFETVSILQTVEVYDPAINTWTYDVPQINIVYVVTLFI